MNFDHFICSQFFALLGPPHGTFARYYVSRDKTGAGRHVFSRPNADDPVPGFAWRHPVGFTQAHAVIKRQIMDFFGLNGMGNGAELNNFVRIVYVSNLDKNQLTRVKLKYPIFHFLPLERLGGAGPAGTQPESGLA